MSGFAVCYGKKDEFTVQEMMKKISHRGNFLEDIGSFDHVSFGQNYLRADTRGAVTTAEIPITELGDTPLTICYDGQINDCEELCDRFGVKKGSFAEERLILHLYRNHKKDMFRYLNNAIFAFVILDGDKMFAARDLLGIKTMFYSTDSGRILLSSELKSISYVDGEVLEFPAGNIMDENGSFTRFGKVNPEVDYWEKDVETMKRDIRVIIEKHIAGTIDFRRLTGGLLSGGMDSSVINYICSKQFKAMFGDDEKLKTFSIGVGESEDIKNARLMADHIDSEHYEILVTIDDLIDVLPEVIYYLENFDPSLVRSSVANYLISHHASKEHDIEVLLSGEGGDEIFCGYTHLKNVPHDEMVEKQIECLSFLHNNASLRLDRMNQCNSVKVVAPLISGELLDYALKIPPQYKQYDHNDTRIEKWIFRQAYEGLLPQRITSRIKQEFSQGSGSAEALQSYFDDKISDSEFSAAENKHDFLRSKEEYFYFKIFAEYFGKEEAVETVGQWVSI